MAMAGEKEKRSEDINNKSSERNGENGSGRLVYYTYRRRLLRLLGLFLDEQLRGTHEQLQKLTLYNAYVSHEVVVNLPLLILQHRHPNLNQGMNPTTILLLCALSLNFPQIQRAIDRHSLHFTWAIPWNCNHLERYVADFVKQHDMYSVASAVQYQQNFGIYHRIHPIDASLLGHPNVVFYAANGTNLLYAFPYSYADDQTLSDDEYDDDCVDDDSATHPNVLHNYLKASIIDDDDWPAPDPLPNATV